MIISINPDWRIRSDPLQWIIERTSWGVCWGQIFQDGWRRCGEFKTLAAALEQAVEWQVMELEADVPEEALTPLLEALSGMRENINELLKDMRP